MHTLKVTCASQQPAKCAQVVSFNVAFRASSYTAAARRAQRSWPGQTQPAKQKVPKHERTASASMLRSLCSRLPSPALKGRTCCAVGHCPLSAESTGPECCHCCYDKRRGFDLSKLNAILCAELCACQLKNHQPGDLQVWFKHDLRLDDHPGLEKATSAEVVPVFCFDPRQLLHLLRTSHGLQGRSATLPKKFFPIFKHTRCLH